MLKKILILGAFACFAAAAHAQVTIAANGVSNLVLSSGGAPLAAGDIIRIGYFSSTSTLGTSNFFSSLNALFTPIGEGSADGDTLSESGVSGDTMEINNFGTTGGFLGQFNGVNGSYLTTGDQLYLWVFNAPTTGAATQWGIFDAPSWTFPSSPGSTTLSLSSAGVTAIRGSVNGSNFELANIPVPEPSALAGLGSVIVLVSAFLRRRARA